MQRAANIIASIEKVGFGFSGVQILEDFSLSLHSGEVTSLVGPSGCGKTTLLRLIAGLEKPDTGKISVETDKYQTPISYMLQDYDAFPWMTVWQNLKLSGERDSSRIVQVADELGLGGMLERHPQQLSGGQRKRVALARSLLASPALLLMDEPFGSLDVRTKISIFDLFERIYLKPDRAGLLVTHSVEEAALLSERVIVLAGPPLEIVADIQIEAQRPRTQAFVQTEMFKSAEAKIMKSLLGR